MRCEQLKIYRPCDMLTDMLLVTHSMMARKYRYTLGNELVTLGLKLMDDIYDVNAGISLEEKYSCCRMLLRTFHCIERRIRKLNHIKAISDKNYADYLAVLEEIGKQATAWKKYYEDMTKT